MPKANLKDELERLYELKTISSLFNDQNASIIKHPINYGCKMAISSISENKIEEPNSIGA